MHYRTLGRTGFQVSEIGFGAWGIGGGWWKGEEDRESLESLRRALELGVNFIDTAITYGNGHSEELVGQVVRAWKEKVLCHHQDTAQELQLPRRAGYAAARSISQGMDNRMHGEESQESMYGAS